VPSGQAHPEALPIQIPLWLAILGRTTDWVSRPGLQSQ
jgi:hypothetical protein